ncbi:hypothetical protein BD779DRAFT_1475803 [Infundibulicybe gibba]|nr:hypothetical protein BD779DRAFT_1475803 [Infundibulicybe gibba]
MPRLSNSRRVEKHSTTDDVSNNEQCRAARTIGNIPSHDLNQNFLRVPLGFGHLDVSSKFTNKLVIADSEVCSQNPQATTLQRPSTARQRNRMAGWQLQEPIRWLEVPRQCGRRYARTSHLARRPAIPPPPRSTSRLLVPHLKIQRMHSTTPRRYELRTPVIRSSAPTPPRALRIAPQTRHNNPHTTQSNTSMMASPVPQKWNIRAYAPAASFTNKQRWNGLLPHYAPLTPATPFATSIDVCNDVAGLNGVA